MSLDKIIVGTAAHYRMVCRKCPYHKDADENSEEYCGRSELFQDIMRSLYTLRELKNVYERFHDDSKEE